MSSWRMRERLASWYPDEMPGRWWQAVLWVPVGYASAKLFGSTLPLVAVGALAGTMALVHWMVPVVVDLVAGAGALVVGVSQAADDGCHLRLGDGGVAVLLVFGGLVIGAAGTRLMGPVKVKESGRRLLLATVALELSLSLAARGNDVAPGEGSTGTAVALAVLLAVVALVGILAPFGPYLLGAGLLATETVLATTGGACQPAATRALVGTVVFVPVALLLTARWRPPYLPDDEPDEDENPDPERWAGDYDDYGPLPEPS